MTFRAANPVHRLPPERSGRKPTQVAWDDLKALQFAIDFSQMSPSEALGASEDVAEFVNRDGDADPQTVASVHAETRELLGDLMRDGYGGYDVRLCGIITMRRDAHDADR